MQEKMNIEIDKELYDDIQILKQVIPQETEGELDDNEVLKLVVGTFMAFAITDEGEEDGHNHDGGCDCGTGCDCN